MKRIESSTSDIISNLPSNITDNILKYLSLRDAARTSVLSSKWRYKWITIPQLAFDGQFLKLWNDETVKAMIYQVLLHHKGPLIKFKLCNPRFGSCIDINNWILILLEKNIQKFTLRLQIGQHKLSCHLFSFQQLRHLNLAKCVFEPPPRFKGFNKLVNLELHKVTFARKMFGNFISNCPLLERLSLDDCTPFHFLEINAPNLKVFDYFGMFKDMSFISTPILANVSIGMFPVDLNINWLEKGKYSNMVKFFRGLPVIKNLNLDSNLLELFALGNVPNRLPSDLNLLKVLVLSDVCYRKFAHISCALCLIRSTPNLQKLEISGENYTTPIENDVEFWEIQDSSNLSLNQLQEVKLEKFSGAQPEMHFVKILLAHSPMLKKMKILPKQGTSVVEGFVILKELTWFSRASPKAEVMYMDRSR